MGETRELRDGLCRRGRRGDGSRCWIGPAFCAGTFPRYHRRPHEVADTVAASLHAVGGRVGVKGTDAARESDIVALFDGACEANDLELVIYNVGSNFAVSALETQTGLFEDVWRQNALGGFLVGRRPPACRFQQRNHTLHWRDRLAARPSAIPRICRRQSRAARRGAGIGSRIWVDLAPAI